MWFSMYFGDKGWDEIQLIWIQVTGCNVQSARRAVRDMCVLRSCLYDDKSLLVETKLLCVCASRIGLNG